MINTELGRDNRAEMRLGSTGLDVPVLAAATQPFRYVEDRWVQLITQTSPR